VGLGEGAAEDGEVLGEDVHQAAVDPAGAGDDAITGEDLLLESEVGGAVGDEAIELDEAALVEQEIQPLSGGELALLVLLSNPIGASALLGEALPVMKVIQEFSGVGHRGEDIEDGEDGEDVAFSLPSMLFAQQRSIEIGLDGGLQ
jgi:hypothetical protein